MASPAVLKANESPLGRFFKCLRLVSSSLLFGYIGAYLSWSNNQLRDAVQVIAEDWTKKPVPAFGFVLDLFLFSAAVAFCGVFVLRKTRLDDVDNDGWMAKLLLSLPLIFGVLPGIALALRAVEMNSATQAPDVSTHLKMFAALSVAGSVLGIAFAWNYAFRKDNVVAAFLKWVLRLSVAAWLIGIILFTVMPYEWGSMWGPVATYFAGLAFWLLVITLLVWKSEERRVPYLWILVGIVAFVQYFNLQRDRDVALVKVPLRNSAELIGGAPGSISTSATDFTLWLRNRPDKQKFAGKPYPVILVSAEGGGIRAAVLTALTLAKLDELAPGFSDHVYCMSGVSGGSVGLGFYRAMIESDRHHPTTLSRTDRLRNLLSKDFLSAPLGRMMFTDAPSAWIPGLRAPYLDRSAALTAAFRQAFRNESRSWTGADEDILGKPLSTLDISQGPNLLLNTSSITKQSPFMITRLNLDHSVYRLQNFGDDCDMTLADAMCLSSRFPGISSAGVLRWPSGPKGPDRVDAFVDGGYSDNSGLESLGHVLGSIGGADLFYDKSKIRVLIVRIGSDLTQKYISTEEMEKSLPHGADLLSPLLAATNVYLSSVLNSEGKMFQKVDAIRFGYYWYHSGAAEATDRFISATYAPIVLKDVNRIDPNDQLPLGWIISRRSIDKIYNILGTPVDFVHDSRPESQNGYQLYHIQQWMLGNDIGNPREPTPLTPTSVN